MLELFTTAIANHKKMGAGAGAGAGGDGGGDGGGGGGAVVVSECDFFLPLKMAIEGTSKSLRTQ